MRVHFAYVLGLAACGAVQPTGDGPQALTISVTGGGSVTSAPTGISCGTTCTAEFAAGTSVTLTAAPDGASAFLGWGGDCAGLDACTISMDAAKTATAGFAPHGSKRWVQQVSFSGQDAMQEVLVAPDGNVIVGGTITEDDGTDILIVKYAKEDGHVLWMQRLNAGNNFPFLGGMAVDATGDVYFAARLQGNGAVMMIGSTGVTGDLFGNVIAAGLNGATGAPKWAKQWGGDGQEKAGAVAVSGNDVYIAGNSSSNPATFDTKSYAGTTGDGFLVRASAATGTVIELKQLVGAVSIWGAAVNGNHVALAGSLRAGLTLDGRCNMTAGSSADAIILDFLGSNLSCQWGKNFGDFATGNDATGQAIAPYPGGGWVLAGDFTGSIFVSPSGSGLTSRGSFDVFAARFTEDGNHVWSFRYGDVGFDVGYGVAVTPEGNTLLAGAFGTTITFGTITVTGTGNTFVTRMSAGTSPTHEWAVGIGGNDGDLAEGVAVAPDGSVYTMASFNGMTDVLGTPLSSQDRDAWIAALVR